MDWHSPLIKNIRLAQFNYALCLDNGKGISIDFQGAVHFSHLLVIKDISLVKMIMSFIP
jgi:hypothetical protein